MSNSTITPTKKNPTFTASCTYFGAIENGSYKNTEVNNSTTDTFAISFAEAVTELHNWIKLNDWAVLENPKCKFEIYSIDGTLDKWGETKRVKVYSISAAKAKKYIL